MSEAPEKIWAWPHGSESRGWLQGYCCSEYEDMGIGEREYHLARPNQPCSTDEFLRLAADKTSKGYDISWRVVLWVDGCFTAALEGLK